MVVSTLDKDYFRIIVVGSLQGDYKGLITFLYDQQFSYEDALILTGDFIDLQNSSSLDILYFIKNNPNCFSVKGKNEVSFIEKYDSKEVPDYYTVDPSIVTFIEELPSCIELDSFYVVNKGLEPYKSLTQQHDKVTYSIGLYDKESRYYQFTNNQKKSWYEFKREDKGVIFSNPSVDVIECSAGYNLPHLSKELSALIITSNHKPLYIAQGC